MKRVIIIIYIILFLLLLNSCAEPISVFNEEEKNIFSLEGNYNTYIGYQNNKEQIIWKLYENHPLLIINQRSNEFETLFSLKKSFDYSNDTYNHYEGFGIINKSNQIMMILSENFALTGGYYSEGEIIFKLWEYSNYKEYLKFSPK